MVKVSKKIKKNTKGKQKGITLLALVITIVVLLIIAGISISMLTGENGTIRQAGNAKLLNEIGTIKEAIDIKDIGKQEDDNYNKRQTFGSITDVLGEEYKKYDKKYAIEAGNIVYKDNKFSKNDIEILEENGIEKESKHYLIMNEGTKQSKYEGREEAITLKELQDKITDKEFSGEEGKYNKAYIIEDLDLGSKWDEEGNLTDGEQWVPITEIPVNTMLDGCEHRISGMYLNSGEIKQALINNNKGIIQGINVDENCWINGSDYEASLCVENFTEGIIRECKNYASIKASSWGWYHGGICTKNSGEISKCSNYGKIDIGGGICGYQEDEGKITLCDNYGIVSLKFNGVTGAGILERGGGLVDKCANYGKILGQSSGGGIVGEAGSFPYTATKMKIKSCVNYADINGSGILKNALIENVVIECCYNIGGNSEGNIVRSGKDTTVIKNCYNVGKCIRDGVIYGYNLVNNSKGIILSSYYLNEEREEGKIISEAFMKTQEFVDMLNTDAETGENTDAYVMDIKGINNGYPILKWQLEN